MEEAISAEDRIQIDDLNGEVFSTRSGARHPVPYPLVAVESLKPSSSLPLLKAVEIVPPKCKENYLEILSNSDPRVSFESLHLGLLDIIEKRSGSRKRRRETAYVEEGEGDNESERGKVRVDTVASLMARPTGGTNRGGGQNPFLFVEVNPLHKIVSERQPFVVELEDAQKVLSTTKKKILAGFVGDQVLDMLHYSGSLN